MVAWFDLSATPPAAADSGVNPAPNAAQSHGAEPIEFAAARVMVATQDGRAHTFAVELANTAAQRQRGLMFRESLAADHGMLFDFGDPRRISMWMKNTLISLDMLFIDRAGRVVHIAAQTQPQSLQLITAPLAVRYVLELPAGTTTRLNLDIGDRLQVQDPG